MQLNALISKEKELKDTYGHLLTIKDIAGIFRYPSSESVLKAHHRGSLPVKLLKFPKRKSLFATPKAVALILIDLDEEV